MKIGLKEVKRGIWSGYEFANIASDGSSSPLSLDAVPLPLMALFGTAKSEEEHVRNHIRLMLSQAKQVLEKAGHPIKEGIYCEDSDGRFEWIREDDLDEVKLTLRGDHCLWPNFIVAEKLSIEQFAVRVARYAGELLAMLESGRNNWQVASTCLNLGIVSHWFGIEFDGLAKKIEKANASESGRKKVNVKKSEISNDKQCRILKYAEIFFTETKNRNFLKPSILAKAFFDSLPNSSQGKKEMSLSTIRRYVKHLVSKKIINFPTRAV